MFMGGMIGKVLYTGVPAEYIPMLRLSEQVHVGKASSFGLGKISVRLH
jgi:CRISPR/Cas system endoribonuclease Cas6 (RAMP superfamily)